MLPARYAGVSAIFRMADILLAWAGHDGGPGAMAGAGVWQRAGGAWPGFATLVACVPLGCSLPSRADRSVVGAAAPRDRGAF